MNVEPRPEDGPVNFGQQVMGDVEGWERVISTLVMFVCFGMFCGVVALALGVSL